MASTRSTALSLARRGVHTPVAVAAATTKTISDWAHTTDRFTQTVGDELLRCVNGETDSPELASRVTRAARTHLRELAALPAAAARHVHQRRTAAAITTSKETP